MQKFSLTGTANHILQNWKSMENSWTKSNLQFLYHLYFWVSRLYPACLFSLSCLSFSCWIIQGCKKKIVKEEKPQEKVRDNLVSLVDCLFYCQYQLPCKFLWHYCITKLFFSTSDCGRWAALFKDCSFEIYELTTKTYVENEIYYTIIGLDRVHWWCAKFLTMSEVVTIKCQSICLNERKKKKTRILHAG